MRNRKKHPAQAWLMLITNLPGKNQTLRMRLWRALKAAGAGLLRDGVYVLPHSPNSRKLFEEQAQEIVSGGGTGYVVVSTADSPEQAALFFGLFDRSAEYAEALERLSSLVNQFSKLSETEARQKLAAARREITALMERDFFPGKAQEQMAGALSAAEAGVNRQFSPDEPSTTRKEIGAKDRKAYRGRTWATREHLWIDRVASAWLIRRFVDPDAKFLWLKRPKDCPKRAVGFDFDGAEFTHVGSKVTFEVLVASFGLEKDPALARLCALVHQLDVGGIPVPEASGFATIMAGARALQQNDGRLLDAMAPVLDSLYAGYKGPPKG
jgi:hypothetical protein